MRILICIVFLLFSLNGLAQTQVELNRTAKERRMDSENQLGALIAEIRDVYSSDSVFLVQLSVSQKAWENFKDAEMRLKYPPRDPGYYGSNYSMCLNIYLTDLINERIDHLQQWIRGAEPGDGCAGSVREE